MKIGIPKEIKDHEGRVALTPAKTALLTNAGHEVLVEKSAGLLSGFKDEEYIASGAKIASAENVWHGSELLLKVKEPLPAEYPFLRKSLTVFTFFHFSANPALKKACEASGVRVIPYECVLSADGSRPILKAMSLIAGEIAADVGAEYLRQENGGCGILLRDAVVTILGAAGSAGGRALQLLRPRAKKIFALDIVYKAGMHLENVSQLQATPQNIGMAVRKSHLVIAAATNKTAGAPKLITRKMINEMPELSVLVDVAIDEGGVSETSRVTTHTNPVYLEGNVLHFCVPNMPGAAPRSSTIALSEASFPYVFQLANGSDIKLLSS